MRRSTVCPWFVRGLKPQNRAINETVPLYEQLLARGMLFVCFSLESQCGSGAHYELREPMRSSGGAS